MTHETIPDMTPAQARAEPSVSGYGWTLDGMYPFFPATPCLHCGKFVGRSGGSFHVEYFEMSSEIASMDAEHDDCYSKWDLEWRARTAA